MYFLWYKFLCSKHPFQSSFCVFLILCFPTALSSHSYISSCSCVFFSLSSIFLLHFHLIPTFLPVSAFSIPLFQTDLSSFLDNDKEKGSTVPASAPWVEKKNSTWFQCIDLAFFSCESDACADCMFRVEARASKTGEKLLVEALNAVSNWSSCSIHSVEGFTCSAILAMAAPAAADRHNSNQEKEHDGASLVLWSEPLNVGRSSSWLGYLNGWT